MTVKQAREVARQWMVEEASAIPGFCGPYTAGSTNWLPSDLGVSTIAGVRRRCAEIERILPQVFHPAEGIIAANNEIEDD
jgi:hypothetical protein